MPDANQPAPPDVGEAFRRLVAWALIRFPKLRDLPEVDRKTWVARSRSSRLPHEETARSITEAILDRVAESPRLDEFSPEELKAGRDALVALLKGILGYELDPWENSKRTKELVTSAIADARAGRPCRHRRIPPPKDGVSSYIKGLFADAKIPVDDGIAQVDAETRIDLQPLYQYLSRLQTSAEIPNYFPGAPWIRLDDLYVELTACKVPRTDAVAQPPGDGRASMTADPVVLWKSAARSRRIPLDTLLVSTDLRPAVLFGDPGSGKSTLTHFALHSLARRLVAGNSLFSRPFLPFRISLREFSRDGADDEFEIIRYIIHKILGIKDPARFEDWRFLLSHLFGQERRLFLLIDGIDEITPNQEEFARLQKKFDDITAVARLLFTSRRAGFDRPTRHFSTYELVELSENSIQALISNWFRHVCERKGDFPKTFQRWIFEDPRRQEMASNPCLLSLLCFLNEDASESSFIQGRNRAELYQRAVEKLTSDPRLHSANAVDPKLDVLSHFALARYRGLGTDPVPLTLFNRQELVQFLSERRRAPSLHEQVPSVKILDRCWVRTRLISQWNLGSWYHFLHLSFQEYFAACALMELPTSEVDPLIEAQRFNPYWREVWRFYSGLCALAGSTGKPRFEALARGHTIPPDIFGQSLFLLASLCAENGVRDSSNLLGFDLRRVLLDSLNVGQNRTRAHIRMVVDIDPPYFLEYATAQLSKRADDYRQPERGNISWLDGGETQSAIGILECIYHKDALAFHADLIRAEMGCRWLRRTDQAVGPTVPSGRNFPLGECLVSAIAEAAGPLQLERGISYLACVRTHEAAQCILATAQRLLADRSIPCGKPVNPALRLELAVHCLWALCELEAPESVQLAEELWKDSVFRERHLDQAASFLSILREPAVGRLAERWLVEEGHRMPPETLVPVIELLKPWESEEIPAFLNTLVEDPAADPDARVSAWEIIATRGAGAGRERLRAHLQELAARRQLNDADLREIVGLSEFIATRRPPFYRELEALRRRRECRGSPFVVDALGAAITCVHSAFSGVRQHHDWLLKEVVPEFHRRLQRSGSDLGRLSHWLAAFRDGPPEVLAAVNRSIRRAWAKVDESGWQTLLQFYLDHPRLVPSSILKSTLTSADPDLRATAYDILAEVAPGNLVRDRHTDEEIGKVLHGNAVKRGILYFEDRLYSPESLRFEAYGEASQS